MLAASNSPLGLSELAKATHMSKSTVHRLAASMCARQYVEKSSDGLYSIGYKLIETVSLHINQLELLTEAKPFLSDIMRDLDLTAHLGILDGCDVVYLEKMDIYPNTRLYTQVGYRASGSIAQLSDDKLEMVIREVKQAAEKLSRRMGYVE